MTKMRKKDLAQIALETKIGTETFIPILELCYMALRDIYGKDCEKDCTQMVEVFNDRGLNIGFGVITHYFDSRVGFTLPI